MIITQGTQDTTVLPVNATKLTNTLTADIVPNQVIWYDAGHVFAGLPGAQEHDIIVRTITWASTHAAQCQDADVTAAQFSEAERAGDFAGAAGIGRVDRVRTGEVTPHAAGGDAHVRLGVADDAGAVRLVVTVGGPAGAGDDLDVRLVAGRVERAVDLEEAARCAGEVDLGGNVERSSCRPGSPSR